MITFGCLDKRGEIMDGRKNGWIDGRMDGWMDAVSRSCPSELETVHSFRAITRMIFVGLSKR